MKPIDSSRPDDYRDAVLRVETLYSTPQILGRALKLVRRPDVGFPQIVDLVSRDQALTADLLHLSNTALFRRGPMCTRISEALQRLGVNELLRLICLSLSKNFFGKDLAHYGVTSGQYWCECVWSAVLMEALTRGRPIDGGEAYVVGLLFQIGKVLINEILVQIGTNVLWDGRTPVELWEQDHVGFTFADAGSMLLRRWDFPAGIVDPIAGHLKAGSDPSHSFDTLIGLVRANRVCLAASDPANIIRGSRPLLSDDFAQSLGFPNVGLLKSLLESTTAHMSEIRQSLTES